jgi:hypothetical protein
MGEIIHEHKIARPFYGKRLLERPGRRGVDNIKIYHKEAE